MQRVYAVGDCEPAARALDALHSAGSAHMRSLVTRAQQCDWQWLSVQVPREANVDADRLSHPDLAAEVVAEIVGARLGAQRLRASAESWAATRQAIERGAPAAERRHYKRRRKGKAAGA